MRQSFRVSAKHTNRLAMEKSPYLLQHAQIQWTGSRGATRRLKKPAQENKPIFLSVGYSTCHWCHVMERESFEDERVGQFLNGHFVSIKVDREERPDVDKIYMTFVQSTTGSGGWPMNVFLTPDLKPFYGGTYFPPDNRHGRPGFLHLLQQISQLWQERKNEITASAEEIHARLEGALAVSAGSNTSLTADVLKNAAAVFKSSYDPVHGGFGSAPKFPQPSIPSLLLRCAKRFHDDEAARMVLHTCERMAGGGIHDQLGGGFSRYSVDAGWLVPHFEKMLYDNAQLVQLYLDAHLVSEGRVPRVPEPTSGKSSGFAELVPPNEMEFAVVARDILDYVLRDMTHPDGGFFSAEDADSEGHEGKFYCWTKDELSKLLTVEEFNVAAKYFGITLEGNFTDHSHPQPLAGQNVLSVVNPIGRDALPRVQADRQVGPTDLELFASTKRKMLTARAKCVRPHLDDKILASWNGLMLGAFARASVVLGQGKYLAAAEKNLEFIRKNLWTSGGRYPLTPALSPREREKYSAPCDENAAANPSNSSEKNQDERLPSPLPEGEGQGEGKTIGTLFHRWRDGERDNVQLLEGYAFLLSGVIELYEATLEPGHLDFAIELADAMIARFHDAENGGFWQSAGDAKDLILRVKDDYDGAEPSGNSVATLALLKLGAITGRDDFTEAAEKTLSLFARRLKEFPQAMPFMLHALDFSLQEPRRVVVAGNSGSPELQELLRAAHSVYQPHKIVLGNNGAVEAFARGLPSKHEATVYVCAGNSCQPPTGDPAKVRALMQ